jgi:uncharacterized protein YndB with AHSA1/START domain
MDTKAITHEVVFNASSAEVFELLTDEKKHAAFTGAPALIERRVGGRFTCYGDQLEGKILELEPDARIVQEWRSQKWPEGHLSRATFGLTAIADGRQTLLSFTQTGVPVQFFDDIDRGWHTYYWLKMAAYLREKKVAVVRRFMEEFKNRQNLDIVDELFAPDFLLHLPGAALPPGPESQKNVGRAIFAAFSGVHVEINDTVVEGDRVVERHTARARHTGTFNGVPATGRDVYWTENHIYRLRDGRIAEAWSELSFHDLMAQITATAAASRAS